MKTAKQKASRKAPPAPAPVPATTGTPGWVYMLAFLLALGTVFLVYGPALNGPFVLDDPYLPFLKERFPSDLRYWIRGVRPALMFSFWLNYQSSGQDPESYHVLNVFLHFVDSIVVFFLVRKLLLWAKTQSSLLTVLSAFAAGVFLLHPLQTESVAYVASRSEVLSVLLFNTAFAVFLYRRSEAISVPAAIGVLILFAGAVTSKEHTAMLPFLLLLTDYFWNPGFRLEGIRRNWKLYVPIALGAAAAGAFIFRTIRGATTAGFSIKAFTWYEYFFTQCRVIWSYIRLFLFPFGQNIDPEVDVSRNLLDPFALAGLIALILVSIAAWHYRRRYTLAAFGWFVFLLLLAPTSSVVPVLDLFAEHRTYLPFLGLLLISVDFLRRWRTAQSTLIAALTVILLVEAGLTYQRTQTWGSAIALWLDSATKSPHKVRPNFQLAKAYYDAGEYPQSVAQYARTAQIQRPKYDLLVDWALALNGTKQYGEALDKLEQAAIEHPSAHIYSELARQYGLLSNYDQALAYLAKAQQLDAGYDMTYVYRGMTYQSMGDNQRAETEYQHALQLNPQNPLAPGLLQNLLARH